VSACATACSVDEPGGSMPHSRATGTSQTRISVRTCFRFAILLLATGCGAPVPVGQSQQLSNATGGGWFLMAPPISTDLVVNDQAPFRQWRQLGAFGTSEACDHAKNALTPEWSQRALQMWTEQKRRGELAPGQGAEMSEAQAAQGFHLIAATARCVPVGAVYR
jgi:hypothetical protein